MYRTGHLGVSLLVYAPLLFVFLTAGRIVPAVAGGAIMLGLASLPDYDQRVPFVTHRGVTHTLAFSWIVGLVVGGAAFVLTPGDSTAKLTVAVLGFGIGALGIVAHLLGDVITPAGITPFWPLSSRTYSLDLTKAANPIANYLLFALGVFATAVVVLVSSPVN